MKHLIYTFFLFYMVISVKGKAQIVVNDIIDGISVNDYSFNKRINIFDEIPDTIYTKAVIAGINGEVSEKLTAPYLIFRNQSIWVNFKSKENEFYLASIRTEKKLEKKVFDKYNVGDYIGRDNVIKEIKYINGKKYGIIQKGNYTILIRSFRKMKIKKKKVKIKGVIYSVN